MPLISYREALNDAMREEMQRDPNIFIMGEDVGFTAVHLRLRMVYLPNLGRSV